MWGYNPSGVLGYDTPITYQNFMKKKELNVEHQNYMSKVDAIVDSMLQDNQTEVLDTPVRRKIY